MIFKNHLHYFKACMLTLWGQLLEQQLTVTVSDLYYFWQNILTLCIHLPSTSSD